MVVVNIRKGETPKHAGSSPSQDVFRRWAIEEHPDTVFAEWAAQLEQKNKESWQWVADQLENGEGYLPDTALPIEGADRFFHWVRIVNDDNPRKPVLCTIMLQFERPAPSRSYWEFLEEIFAVYARKGYPPNPVDALPDMRAPIYRNAEDSYCERPYTQDDAKRYELISKEIDSGEVINPDPELKRPPRVDRERDRTPGYAGVRPVGVRVERNPARSDGGHVAQDQVWVFPHLRVGTGLLADTLVEFRRNGVQRIPLSLLRKAVRMNGQKGKRVPN